MLSSCIRWVHRRRQKYIELRSPTFGSLPNQSVTMASSPGLCPRVWQARTAWILAVFCSAVMFVRAEDSNSKGATSNGFVHESVGATSSCKEVAYMYRAKGLRDQVPSSSISGMLKVLCRYVLYYRRREVCCFESCAIVAVSIVR